jgi:hypothetical protein
LIRDRQAPVPQCLLTEINLTAKRIACFFSTHAILIDEARSEGANYITEKEHGYWARERG